MVITIRPATEADVPMLQALIRENGLELEGVDYSKWSHPTLVAVREGEVVGLIQAHLGSPYAVVTDLAIARVQQRKGYAAKLVDSMELRFRAAGINAYVWFVGMTEDAMLDQSKRWGGHPTGEGIGFVRRLE